MLGAQSDSAGSLGAKVVPSWLKITGVAALPGLGIQRVGTQWPLGTSWGWAMCWGVGGGGPVGYLIESSRI